jgi:hypothetical protein
MPITFKIGDSSANEEQRPIQATIELQISKTLDGNLLINDHKYMDIVVVPSEGRIVTMPKPYAEKDVYDYQKDLMYYLFKSGISNAMAPEGGPFIGMMETNYPLDSEVDPLQASLLMISEYIAKTAADEMVADEYDENIEDNFVDPPDTKTTEYGEIKPYQDTPGANAIGDPTYTFAGYGYLY